MGMIRPLDMTCRLLAWGSSGLTDPSPHLCLSLVWQSARSSSSALMRALCSRTVASAWPATSRSCATPATAGASRKSTWLDGNAGAESLMSLTCRPASCCAGASAAWRAGCTPAPLADKCMISTRCARQQMLAQWRVAVSHHQHLRAQTLQQQYQYQQQMSAWTFRQQTAALVRCRTVQVHSMNLSVSGVT